MTDKVKEVFDDACKAATGAIELVKKGVSESDAQFLTVNLLAGSLAMQARILRELNEMREELKERDLVA